MTHPKPPREVRPARVFAIWGMAVGILLVSWAGSMLAPPDLKWVIGWIGGVGWMSVFTLRRFRARDGD